MRNEPVRRHMAAEGIDGPLPPTAFAHDPIVDVAFLVAVEGAILNYLKEVSPDGDD